MLSSENNPFEAFSGMWKWPCSECLEKNEFMHIGSDGRVVSSGYIDPEKDQKWTLRHWVTRIDNDEYEVCLTPGGEGWRVKIHTTKTGLRIVSVSGANDLTPTSDFDIPDWWDPMLKEGLERMKEEETLGK
ncbi:hypothetical protein N9Z18_01055 [Verrucomicrobiales bacterium]|jgi:hypothetical protein|nr:hypothetical protein [Verrucomicrobiales bacterium]MDB4358810.1 hypothetical protein [Verrucomicrobiales bacterium]|tara:strand:+ start:115 stop:507 length:393 start_codon:yes stop_codon:yes gene_type:complete